jgi:hypothetical protein
MSRPVTKISTVVVLAFFLWICPLSVQSGQSTQHAAYQAGTWIYTGGPIGGLGYDVRMGPQ